MINNSIFLTKAALPSFDEYQNELKKSWETHWLTTFGYNHQILERMLREYLNVPNVQLFANGHAALEAAIQALNLRGEVITTPFTFASTTHAIVRSGLRPRFCDVKMNNFTIDESKIEELINENTCAILAVHLFGNVCDVHEIDRIAKKYKLKVIYDAAHAFGVRIGEKSIALYGDEVVYSFHASKPFHTVEGGAIVYKDNQITELLEKIRMFGMGDNEYVEVVGFNGKMNELEAAMGICNLRRYEDDLQRRAYADRYYRERLYGVRGITLNEIQPNLHYNYPYFPILVDADNYGETRDSLLQRLHSNNILARAMFFQLSNEYPCYPKEFQNDKTPIAKDIAKKILLLPLYTDIEESDLDIVCSSIEREH